MNSPAAVCGVVLVLVSGGVMESAIRAAVACYVDGGLCVCLWLVGRGDCDCPWQVILVMSSGGGDDTDLEVHVPPDIVDDV